MARPEDRAYSLEMRDSIALITGGASGIGRALGAAMAARGAHVVLADRQIDAARDAAAQIEARGGSAEAHALDVRDARAFEALAQDVKRRRNRIDYLFNNAGIGVGGEISDYDLAAWDDVFDVNIRGVAYGVQAVYPIMRAQGSGHIVNTASVAGLLSAAGAGSYAASKHAVVGLSKSLRIEAARHGVRVSVLCPGAIRTPILTGGVYGRTVGAQIPESERMKFWERLRPMDPDAFAIEVLRDVDRNEAYIIVPRWWKALWMLERLSPSLSAAIWSRAHAGVLEATKKYADTNPAREELEVANAE
jgi:NAD(P)-dependent dehydrogenase (short-subunit alcohol dehydrogenase family)